MADNVWVFDTLRKEESEEEESEEEDHSEVEIEEANVNPPSDEMEDSFLYDGDRLAMAAEQHDMETLFEHAPFQATMKAPGRGRPFTMPKDFTGGINIWKDLSREKQRLIVHPSQGRRGRPTLAEGIQKSGGEGSIRIDTLFSRTASSKNDNKTSIASAVVSL